MTYADFLGRPEADVEDLFDPATYASVLNAAFSLPAAQKLTAKKLKDALPTSTRLVKQAEAAFRTMPPAIPEFDHFTPSAWLLRNPKLLEGDSPAISHALDHAEKICEAYNAFLASICDDRHSSE